MVLISYSGFPTVLRRKTFGDCLTEILSNYVVLCGQKLHHQALNAMQ